MGFRGYLIKRTINTLVLILFVILLNFVIFELLPGQQGSIAAIAENPKLPQAVRKQIVFDEELRLGLVCGGTADNPVPCQIWDKFAKYFVDRIVHSRSHVVHVTVSPRIHQREHVEVSHLVDVDEVAALFPTP